MRSKKRQVADSPTADIIDSYVCCMCSGRYEDVVIAGLVFQMFDSLAPQLLNNVAVVTVFSCYQALEVSRTGQNCNILHLLPMQS